VSATWARYFANSNTVARPMPLGAPMIKDKASLDLAHF
jgi:hypothetical protein